MIGSLNDFMDVIIKLANIIVLMYAAYKFTKRPQESIEEKIAELENRIALLEARTSEIEKKLIQGNDRFQHLGEALEVFARCSLALIDFEIHYCETEHKQISQDLSEARKELHKYLSNFNMD